MSAAELATSLAKDKKFRKQLIVGDRPRNDREASRLEAHRFRRCRDSTRRRREAEERAAAR